jgi:hypothetical protein
MPSPNLTIDPTAQGYDHIDSSVGNGVNEGKFISQVNLPPSPPAENDISMRHASPRGSPVVSATEKEERRITREMTRGAPGDPTVFSNTKTVEQKELAKRKSQYYGDAFAYRESNGSARERVARESPIMVDVKTNVIVSRSEMSTPSTNI